MEFYIISLLNGVSYGLLLLILSSGLTLIFSMMGVLNFAHASFYMMGPSPAMCPMRYGWFRPGERSDFLLVCHPQSRPSAYQLLHLTHKSDAERNDSVSCRTADLLRGRRADRSTGTCAFGLTLRDAYGRNLPTNA